MVLVTHLEIVLLSSASVQSNGDVMADQPSTALLQTPLGEEGSMGSMGFFLSSLDFRHNEGCRTKHAANDKALSSAVLT